MTLNRPSGIDALANLPPPPRTGRANPAQYGSPDTNGGPPLPH
jgi:hypothetical protein